MHNLPRSLAAVALAAALLASPLSVAPAAAATPTFADEFAAGPLNTSVWQVKTPWGTQYNSREQQWYDPANFSFANGEMRIKTEKRTVNGYPYASGMITSRTKYSYGYYEMRAKLPKGKGVWPAFWLLADNYQEIDIFELLGDQPNKIYMTYHFNHNEVYQATYTGPDFSAGYHTFAVDWQPTYIRWYVDDVKRGEYVGNISATAQNIIANTAVGDSTSWPGAPDGSTTMPQYFDVDYIRAYPSKPAPQPVNQAPRGAADAYATDEGTALSVGTPGVLGNDTDPDGNALTATIVSQPAHGSVALSANGSFIYSPAPGWSGTDTFGYQASDGALSSAVIPVSVAVRPVNHAPTATAESYFIDQDTRLAIASPGVLGNDRDLDGDALTAVVGVQPAHGTVTLAADGSFVYTPAPGFSGADSFTYRASDGSLLSQPAVVSVAIAPVVTPPPSGTDTPTPPPAPAPNAAPAAAGDAYAVRRDTSRSVVAPGVLGNDSDADGDALTAVLVTSPSHGSLTLRPDGSFVYVPARAFAGTDSFTYSASDGTTMSAPARVTLTVKGPRRSSRVRGILALSASTAAAPSAESVLSGWWARGRDLILRLARV